MEDFKKRLIYLLHCENASWLSVYQLLKKDPKLQTVYRITPKNPYSQNPSFHSVDYSPTPFSKELILEQIRQYKANDISVITFFDKEYPALLKEIYQPPWALFAKGDIKLLQQCPKLAVVGARQATQYGKNAIQQIFPKLIEKKLVIVSGLARGIDTFAHETAIKNGGKTIAVIAGGFYHIYPKENVPLATSIMKSHLIISEYPPNTKPSKWHFPMRNRIISGLSEGTFIIEAKRKSGSLITANYAVNEGREVFALPGSIFNHLSFGTNDLIQQGAKLVTVAEDILDELQPRCIINEFSPNNS